ncbi:hypothetical protein LTR86_011194 [Recurvomyces mirabilis]|nr:hypothetical protein LTR86_011194 [Recurvomyces mirabilis]
MSSRLSSATLWPDGTPAPVILNTDRAHGEDSTTVQHALLSAQETTTSKRAREEDSNTSNSDKITTKRPKASFVLPTAKNINHTLIIQSKDILDFFEPFEYVRNQGKPHLDRDQAGWTRRSDLNNSADLCIVKMENVRWDVDRWLKKPRSDWIVELRCALLDEKTSTISMVYEVMDLSLSQICRVNPHDLFAIPAEGCFPMEHICSQILSGLLYIHKYLEIRHGDVCVENILLKENGSVKLANIGHSLLGSDNDYGEDFLSLRDILELTHERIERTINCRSLKGQASLSRLQNLLEASKGQEALQLSMRCVADRKTDVPAYDQEQELARLIFRMKRSIYSPPDPVELSSIADSTMV